MPDKDAHSQDPRSNPAKGDIAHRAIREDWAWEFLRRNSAYRMQWQDVPSSGGIQDLLIKKTNAFHADSWGLLKFVDPALPARDADIFWHSHASSNVLILNAADPNSGGVRVTIDAETLRCRIATMAMPGNILHILFAQPGRRLQLEIHGTTTLKDVALVTDAILTPLRLKNRLLLLRQLNTLIAEGELAPISCRPNGQDLRLTMALHALDGFLAGASQREIAVLLFGPDRVKADWYAYDHLRDRTRRVLRLGRMLMEGGYRKLLK